MFSKVRDGILARSRSTTKFFDSQDVTMNIPNIPAVRNSTPSHDQDSFAGLSPEQVNMQGLISTPRSWRDTGCQDNSNAIAPSLLHVALNVESNTEVLEVSDDTSTWFVVGVEAVTKPPNSIQTLEKHQRMGMSGHTFNPLDMVVIVDNT